MLNLSNQNTNLIKLVIVSKIFFIILLIITLGCSYKIKAIQLKQPKESIEVSLKVGNLDTIQNLFHIKLHIKSLIDSVKIKRIDIEQPSCINLLLSSSTDPFILTFGESKSFIFHYKILKKESFKLKVVVFGDSMQTNKINQITYLFFFFDEGIYYIGNDLSDIVGRKKKNGGLIKNEDLAIIARLENKVSDNIKAGNQDSSSPSPYSVSIDQPDGTRIEVIGKGNMNSPYTETIDGYTILRNKDGIYEYAILGDDGKLKPSGLKANNMEIRSEEEIEFLRNINYHLRNLYK